MPRTPGVGKRWEVTTCWLGTQAEKDLLTEGWEPFSTYYVPQIGDVMPYPVLVLRREVES